jgi:hypothetical protein
LHWLLIAAAAGYTAGDVQLGFAELEMSFEIENRGEYVAVRLFGVVTPGDLERLADEGEALELGLPADMNRISDITGVQTFDIKFAAVLNLAKRREVRTLRNPIKSAIIAVQPEQVGFARMFETLNNNPQITVRIVQSRQAALDWFDEK